MEGPPGFKIDWQEMYITFYMRVTISMKVINCNGWLNNKLMASISSRESSTDINVGKYYNHNYFNLAMHYSIFWVSASTSLFYFRLGNWLGVCFYEDYYM